MPISRQPSPRGQVPVAFDKTLTTAGTAEDLVLVPAGLEGVSLSLDVLTANARIGFDATAGPTGSRVLTGSGRYTWDNITVRTRVSFNNDGSGKPRIWGTLWCRRK